MTDLHTRCFSAALLLLQRREGRQTYAESVAFTLDLKPNFLWSITFLKG